MSDHEKPSKSKEEMEREIARNDEIIKALIEYSEALCNLWKAERDRRESKD